MNPDPTFSIVIPTRNEEENALQIAEAVIGEMEKLGDDFELIFIDNASTDSTVQVLRTLCERDPRVRLIVNVRNFGQMRSPTHGIFQARGRAVINMCADFQDPPTLLPRFIDRWRAGTDIVLGVRQSEKSSRRLGLIRRLSYYLANRFGDYPIVPNATGFGLYDRKVVQAIARIREPEPFFRGLLVETGYAIETIAYVRPERAAGVSNNDFFALFDFMLSSLSGMSKRLLRIPLHIGVVVIATAALCVFGGLVAFLLARPAWPWLVAAGVQAQLGLLFFFLGLTGDQIRLLSERSRQTPLVIERERVNFPPEG